MKNPYIKIHKKKPARETVVPILIKKRKRRDYKRKATFESQVN
jgi:hypothetical protein